MKQKPDQNETKPLIKNLKKKFKILNYASIF